MTGGIACYKVPYLVRALDKAGAEIRVVMTEAATRFVTPLTMETVSRHPVGVEMFPERQYAATHHIDLAQWPDLTVVAPATANFLGKTANGICDDLLTTVVCATPHPVMVVPAMNPGMWENPITRKNCQYLEDLGYVFVGPAEGEMAEPGHVGVGRMAEPEEIFAAIKNFFAKASKKKALSGKTIVITAGPTREAIDPVRYMSNRSSGKMGYAIAEAACRLGAETILISGPSDLAAPAGARYVAVETTAQMSRAATREFKRCDCLIMSAAPADFTLVKPLAHKIKRRSDRLSLEFKATPDILKKLSATKKKGQLMVGFALETDNAIANARNKLRDKNLDLIVLNVPDSQSGFSTDTNQVTILRPDKRPLTWPLMEKQQVAFKLLELLSTMM